MASGYGYRIDPFTKRRTMHFGMDFSAKTGTPVYATGDGRIVRADNRAVGFGNHVRIRRSGSYNWRNGVRYCYCSQSRPERATTGQ